jgi:hypothetical protein
VLGQGQLFDQGVDDAQIRLVRNEHVEVRGAEPGRIQGRLGDLGDRRDRPTKNGLTLHADERIGPVAAAQTCSAPIALAQIGPRRGLCDGA